MASSADDVDVDVSQESRLKQIGLNSEFEILLFYFSVERIKLKWLFIGNSSISKKKKEKREKSKSQGRLKLEDGSIYDRITIGLPRQTLATQLIHAVNILER